jgi:hypothetical protein
MKKPRVEDFDPQAVPKLGSPLDSLPAIERPSPSSAMRRAVPQQQTDASLSGSPSVRPSVRTPVRRVITRYAFEFFQDQIERLRGFSLEEKLRSEKGSMSEMVREAVDMYIAKRNRTEGD